jgi:hypothetical protein
MKSVHLCGGCAASILALNMAAFAQATPQQAASSQQQAAADQKVTVTGCIQSEADYRRARDAGRGGAAGTGVGAGNEFVLINASISPASGTPTGTTGAASTMAFELTGTNEGQAAKLAGKRVEIAGMLKAAEVTAGGRPTGGATAGRPPEGVDISSQDLRLRELEVTSLKEVPGACPAQ